LPPVSGSGYVNSSFNNNIYTISVTGLQPSGNYSTVGHTHTSSNITDFNSSVSGLLPVKNITGSGYVSISSSDGNYTVGVTGLQPSGNYAAGTHTHTASQVTDFNTSVSGLVSGIYAPLSNPTFTGTVSGISKSMVGLGSVDNTSDANKPVSSATQTALDSKAALSHTHTASQITDFNSSVSGILPVKNIVAGTNITISSTNGTYTINSSGDGGSSSTAVRGNIVATGTLSSFNISGGYSVGYLDLFQNGVKLLSGSDFTATNGTSVTLSNSVPSGTVLEYISLGTSVAIASLTGIAPGSVSSPTISSSNDLTTGFYFPSSGNISVAGNLGIGTASPSSKLQVVGNITANSGNFSNSLQLNGINVSISGHTHSTSDITNFNSSVSGLIPITNIIAGSGINVAVSGTTAIISNIGLKLGTIMALN